MKAPNLPTESDRLGLRPVERLTQVATEHGRPAADPEADDERSTQAKAAEILPREPPPVGRDSAAVPSGPAAPPAEAPTAKVVIELHLASEQSQPAAGAPPGSARPTDRASDVIPARLLNEFVYCPRLFYYEFVEGVFVENADTVRGKHPHRRVDTDGGALPPAQTGSQKPEGGAPKPETKRRKAETPGQQSLFGPEQLSPGTETAPPVSAGDGEGAETLIPPSGTLSRPTGAGLGEGEEVIHSRSVQMGSQRLGVTAKMDLVEVRAGSDELLGALESCPVDYKAGAPSDGDAGNELWDADRMQLGLQCLILRENGYACREGVVYYRATKQRVRLTVTPELESWIIEQVGAARLAARGAIPPPLANSPKCPRCSLVTVCLPDETRLLAELPQPSTNDSRPASPRRLIAARDDTRALYLNKPGLRVGRKDELLQVKEEKTLLDEVRLNDVSHVALFGNIQLSTQAIQALCEAEIPVTYFSMGGWFYGLTRGHELKNVFLRIEQFRQAQDPAACLRLARQFVHGKIRNHRTLLMRNHLEPPPATLAVGFDPYVGFFHQPRFGRPALALDLMEEFRALVADSTVLSCINNRAITETDFVRAGQAVNLTAPGRRRFFEMYEQRMNSVLTHPVFDYKVSYRRALELQARMLAKVLTGEIPEYLKPGERGGGEFDLITTRSGFQGLSKGRVPVNRYGNRRSPSPV
jgi:CRISPR-associated protein Cas4